MLNAADLGSLGIGSPVYYRRLPVGQVVAYDLSADGTAVTVRVFVGAPYDKFVGRGHALLERERHRRVAHAPTASTCARSRSSRCWRAASRSRRRRRAPCRRPSAASASFRLYPDRATAMKQDEGIATRYVLYFDESLRGLSVGAPVTFFGVPVGEVTAVGLAFDREDARVRPRVEIVVYPERMIANLPSAQEEARRDDGENAEARHAIMLRMVEQRGCARS